MYMTYSIGEIIATSLVFVSVIGMLGISIANSLSKKDPK